MVGAETRTPIHSCSSTKVARAMHPTPKGTWETPFATQTQRETNSPSKLNPSTPSKPDKPSSPSNTSLSTLSKSSNTSEHNNTISSISFNIISDSSNPSAIISNFSTGLIIKSSPNAIKDPSKATNNSIIIILSARRTPKNSIRIMRI